MKHSHRPSSKGFTLVELLVVIGVIAVLVALLLPALNKARRSAIELKCAAHERQLTMAALFYANDNKGTLPPLYLGTNLASTPARPSVFPAGGPSYLLPYLTQTNTLILVCPVIYGNVDTDVYRQVSGSPSGGYTYRYNARLGGYYDRLNDGSGFLVCRPWKVSRVKQSSNVAMFIDGPDYTGDLNYRRMSFEGELGLPYEAIKWADLQPYMSPVGHVEKVQTPPAGGPSITIKGTTNVAFVDGSVRKVNAVKVSVWTDIRSWDNVIFAPERATTAQFKYTYP